MFDASNRQTCTVRMTHTSTPLHALTTLNDPTWVEAARVLAGNALREQPDLEQRLRAAFLRILCRLPTAQEVDILKRMHDKQLAFYSAQPSEARELLAVGNTPGDAALDPQQWAAMTAVCLGIFNFDEALTRE